MLFIQCDLPILREFPVGDTNLFGSDSRLFQGTAAWDLAKAVADDDSARVERILQKHPEIIDIQEPRYGTTVLIQSIYCRRYKAFLALLRNGADVDIHDYEDGASPLNTVFFHSRKDTTCLKYVEKLVEYGADVNDYGRGNGGLRLLGHYNYTSTPLMNACSSGLLDCVKFLVENGADINMRFNLGETALNHAIMGEHYDIAIYLIEHGADFRVPYTFQSSVERGNMSGDDDKFNPIPLDEYISTLSDDDISPEYRKRILYLISQEFKEPSLSHWKRSKKQEQLIEKRIQRYKKIEDQGLSYVYERCR